MEFLKMDGLEVYHTILLILGCLLCFAAITGIIINSIRSAAIKGFIPLIALSIIMIAFPGIKKVSFGKDLLVIETAVDRVLEDPSDEEALHELEAKLNDVNTDQVYSYDKLSLIAQAYVLTGKNEQAVDIAGKAIEKNEESEEANNIIGLAETNILIDEVSSNPQNENAKVELQHKINHLENIPQKNTYTSVKLTEAYIANKNFEKAKEETNRIIERKPDYKPAHKLRDNITHREEEIFRDSEMVAPGP